MVSTYQTRSTQELIAVKATLLAHIGTACDDTADRLAAHLDAIEAELGRRQAAHPVVVRTETVVVDEDGELGEVTAWHCPNCDERVGPGWGFCRTCGVKVAPPETTGPVYLVVFRAPSGAERYAYDRFGEAVATFGTKGDARAYAQASKRAWGRTAIAGYEIREAA